jgi:hypothetical protein
LLASELITVNHELLLKTGLIGILLLTVLLLALEYLWL